MKENKKRKKSEENVHKQMIRKGKRRVERSMQQ